VENDIEGFALEQVVQNRANTLSIRQIRHDELDIARGLPMPFAEVIEDDNSLTLLDERADSVRANVPRSAGDEK
jgi:hypothetical protein